MKNTYETNVNEIITIGKPKRTIHGLTGWQLYILI